ncbi:RNA splicing protein MRS2 mitochondrial precursor [Plasmodium cynomolgi strain B]|uniref:Magnesium transporter n=1 Tax=Plasmodium cynomolgi (strain B) TaxID=1120755 RepID=K6UK28_PLACD|nr:RNA splicing protein MRS2 mitochondrial precursor [Plasmodium cynomolgi strain B]GAB66478.1 RNA splicing protein MRS2 mitochondrial precursor [Plasmodium cynomolgi strain B]
MQNIRITQDGQIKCERFFFSKYSLPYVLSKAASGWAPIESAPIVCPHRECSHNIPVSDLRLIDSSNNHNPTLLVRKNMILLRTGFISCVIRFNELWMFEPKNPLVVKATNLVKKNFKRKSDLDGNEAEEEGRPNGQAQNVTSCFLGKDDCPGVADQACPRTTSEERSTDATPYCPIDGTQECPSPDELNHVNVKNHFYKHKANIYFEFLCLDICMQLSIKEYEEDLYRLNEQIKGIILQQRKEENNEINILTNNLLRDMMKIKNNLQKFSNLLNALRNSIEKILNNHMDMENMYLTFMKTNVTKEGIYSDNCSRSCSPIKDCTDLEIVLETHLQLTDELYRELENVEEKITHYEELMRLNLDYNRNKFILLNVKISFATLFFSISSVITSLFGMNLKNFCEESDYVFFLISLSVCVSSFLGIHLTRNINTILRFFDRYRVK